MWVHKCCIFLLIITPLHPMMATRPQWSACQYIDTTTLSVQLWNKCDSCDEYRYCLAYTHIFRRMLALCWQVMFLSVCGWWLVKCLPWAITTPNFTINCSNITQQMYSTKCIQNVACCCRSRGENKRKGKKNKTSCRQGSELALLSPLLSSIHPWDVFITVNYTVPQCYVYTGETHHIIERVSHLDPDDC